MVLVARSKTELDEAARDVRAAGHAVSTSSFDLLETDAIAGWYERLVHESGPFDILVNDVIEYVRAHVPINPQLEGRIQVLGK